MVVEGAGERLWGSCAMTGLGTTPQTKARKHRRARIPHQGNVRKTQSNQQRENHNPAFHGCLKEGTLATQPLPAQGSPTQSQVAR